MKPARTTSPVNLRTGPSVNYPFVDQLEKHYPLIIRSKVDGWYRVTAKAHGLRLKEQDGYIDSRFVELLPVIVADEPCDPRDWRTPVDRLRHSLDPPGWMWLIAAGAVGVLVLAALALL